jgi:hypothetical protein
MRKENLITIWKKRNHILEGIANSIFKREDVEQIALSRMEICRECPSKLYDNSGKGCVVNGTQPCCDETKGGCGCSLGFKTRSLSDECPMGHWKAELSETEEAHLKSKLGIIDELT